MLSTNRSPCSSSRTAVESLAHVLQPVRVREGRVRGGGIMESGKAGGKGGGKPGGKEGGEGG